MGDYKKVSDEDLLEAYAYMGTLRKTLCMCLSIDGIGVEENQYVISRILDAIENTKIFSERVLDYLTELPSEPIETKCGDKGKWLIEYIENRKSESGETKCQKT